MKVYLAGPINGRSDQDCKDWRETAKKVLSDTLDPMDRDYRGRENEPGIDAEIVNSDEDDIHESDALLVYFDKPSVGTSMEVLYAYLIGKEIFIVNASDKPLSPWLTYHADKIFPTLNDALEFISER